MITYKVKGKRWKLSLLRTTMYSMAIPCLHNEQAGFVLITIKDNGELVTLQTACTTLGLKYQQQ